MLSDLENMDVMLGSPHFCNIDIEIEAQTIIVRLEETHRTKLKLGLTIGLLAIRGLTTLKHFKGNWQL